MYKFNNMLCGTIPTIITRLCKGQLVIMVLSSPHGKIRHLKPIYCKRGRHCASPLVQPFGQHLSMQAVDICEITA